MSDFSGVSPWDAATWFQATKESHFVGQVGAVQCVVADPMRIALIFACNATQPVCISTSAVATTNQGIALTGNSGPAILLFSEVGPIVQGDWFIPAGSTGFLTVIEVRLRAWPQSGRQPRGAQRGNPTSRSTEGNGDWDTNPNLRPKS